MIAERKQLQWYGALNNLIQIGGTGHLQDIRYGAFGTTKGRAAGGVNVQALANQLKDNDLIESMGHDLYRITATGRDWHSSHRPG